MRIKPLGNNVVVKPIAESKSEFLIIAADEPVKGEVIAVGPGKYLDNGDFVSANVNVGDIVIYHKKAGETYELNGENVLMLTGDDIYGIVTE